MGPASPPRDVDRSQGAFLIPGDAHDGQQTELRTCTYPLTGLACITRVYTDLAIFGIKPGRVVVRNLLGIDFATLASLLDVPLTDATRRRAS